MNCRILFIDNTTLIKSPWKKVLIDNFYTSEAVGGFEAVIKLKSDQFDLVIVNLSLKQLNGVDAVAKIREKYPEIPVIAIYHRQQNILNLKQARTYGIQNALPLPVNMKHLIISISKVLPPEKLQQKPSGGQQAVNSEPEEAETSRKEKEYINIEDKYYEALSAVAVNQYDRAIEIYKDILSVTNIKHEAWLKYIQESFFHLGQCYAQLKDYANSNKYYKEFITRAPRHNCVKESFLYLGKNYEAMKKYEKASYFYKKVLNLKPMDSFTTQARKFLSRISKRSPA